MQMLLLLAVGMALERERLFIYTDTRTHSTILSNAHSQAVAAWCGSLAPSPCFAFVPRRAAQSSSQCHFTPPILLILMLLPHARTLCYWYIMHVSNAAGGDCASIYNIYLHWWRRKNYWKAVIDRTSVFFSDPLVWYLICGTNKKQNKLVK